MSTNIDSNNNNTNNSNDDEEENTENDTAGATIIKTYNGGSMCSLNKQADDETGQSENQCMSKFKQVTFGIIKEMFDFKLLCENKSFLLLTMSNFFCFTGYFTPFLYLSSVAKLNGTSENMAGNLIGLIGMRIGNYIWKSQIFNKLKAFFYLYNEKEL